MQGLWIVIGAAVPSFVAGVVTKAASDWLPGDGRRRVFVALRPVGSSKPKHLGWLNFTVYWRQSDGTLSCAAGQDNQSLCRLRMPM